MENRKLGLLILGVFMASGLFFVPSALAYWTDTHEYLTNESINLYNKTAGDNAISADLKQYLFDGSKAEDSDPRYVNHFDDPINDQGLTDVFNGESSKRWVNDRAEQQNIKYAIQPKLGLSSAAYKKIEQFYPTSDFTYNTALKYWINGDREMAMEALGHTLHLIQDLGVPEHTRNDSHTNGSEYEIYANKYSLTNPDKNFAFRLGDKKQIELGSLDAYFDSLARYTNKYFYSPGSIGISGGYNSPEPDYKTAEIKNDGYYYVNNTDDEGQKYYLAAYSSLANIMTPYSRDVFVKEPLIKESYWNLLSVRTVRTSAGVIDLFFRDVEKAKADPSILDGKKENNGIVDTLSAIPGQLWSGTKTVASGIGSFFGSVFNSIGSGLSSATHFVGGLFTNDNGLTDAGSIDLNSSDTTSDSAGSATTKTSNSAAKKVASTKQADEIAALKLQIAGLKKDAQAQDKAVAQLEKAKAAAPEVVPEKVVETTDVVADKEVKQTVATTPVCAYGSGNSAGQRTVIINEVAWMGGVRSASDEWIELKNISGNNVDVSGWQLLNKGGGIKAHLSGIKNPIIKPGQFILLERTDNNSAVGATADLIYSGALGNTNDGLRLFNTLCGVVDEVSVAAHWPAGNNDSKQTMERDANANGWHTSTSAGGTPKKENSAGIAYGGGGGGSAVVAGQTKQTGVGTSTNSGQGGDSITPMTYPPLLIAEVQLAGASSTHDEFIKLYNPNDVAVDLTGWYVQKKTKTAADFSTFAKADLFTGKQIASHSFFTIAHPSSTVAYDVASDYGIADDNTLIIKNPNGDIVDTVGWGAASDCEGTCVANPANGQTITRRYDQGSFVDTNNNVQDFALSALRAPIVLTENATTTIQTQNPDSGAGMTLDATSTIYWDGGPQSGTVYELFTDRWVGQRVHFTAGVDVGTIEFGYYNDYGAGSVDAAIFDAGGAQKWTTALTVPPINTGGYISYHFSTALYLVAGDYFVGSRLVAGNVGIRKGYGSNVCGSAVYGDGTIPSCNDGSDVSMRISKWAAGDATSTIATSTSQAGDGGSGNATTTATTTAIQLYPIVINEIMYDLPGADDSREWIELYNNGTSSVAIADWRLNENDTNHLLHIKQGTSTLPAGGYAVIANDSIKFFADHNGFNGPVFDSAFSLSNDGETITLKNGDLIIDTVTYASSTGAQGDGKSLQKFADGWHSASSTPGAVNVLPVVIIVTDPATTTATTTPTETATSTATTTDNTATTTEPTSGVVIGNRIDTEKTASGPVYAFYQTLTNASLTGIRSFRVAVEGVSGRWQGGICEFDMTWRKCVSNLYLARVNADKDVVSDSGKTLLTFTFASDIPLDPSKRYALGVIPTGSVPMGSRVASIYGSAVDVYPDGKLYFSEDGMYSSVTTIADMYFEMQ